MKNIYKKGYSLVEILVYLAIFTALSVLVINSFILALASFSASRTNRDLLEGGATAMERMSREIKGTILALLAIFILVALTSYLPLDSFNLFRGRLDQINNLGGIVLGVGGDNSNNSWGTFYEGAIVAGYPTAATDLAVMKNVQAVGYTK